MKWLNEIRKVSDLVPAEYNPRKISAKDKKSLKDSLSRFSVADPIIINKNNRIIGGHQRITALIEEGVQEVEVRVPERELTADEEKELNLRLNRNQGEWDFDKLEFFGPDMIRDVGFSGFEIDKIFEVKEDDFDVEKEYQSIIEPVARRGDVFILGDHRLMCGDATSLQDFGLLMAAFKARLIFTDPPYNVDYKSQGGRSYSSVEFGGNGKKIFNDKKTEAEALAFYTNVLKNLFNMTSEDTSIYWWFANRNNWINRLAFIDSGWHMSQIIIWLKNGVIFAHGWEYHRCYEPCMVGWKKGHEHYKNKKIADLRDVFNLEKKDFEEILDVWYERRDAAQDYVHPTQKPIRLAERAIKKSSERGDIVLDCFGGSGSTMLACEQMERKCFMMELDPKFVDCIVKRWEQFTGKKADKVKI
ncbi:MAG: adenine specific methyltransferase [Siphoviridae sp. ctCJE6]|nr:MAG: adenine specific methyltransferase [Siphoviridae sp. ctCJE6]